jgi:hypothetical protein
LRVGFGSLCHTWESDYKIFFDKAPLHCPPLNLLGFAQVEMTRKILNLCTHLRRRISKIFLFFVVKTQSKCEKEKRLTMALYKYLGIIDSTSIGNRALKFSKNGTSLCGNK